MIAEVRRSKIGLWTVGHSYLAVIYLCSDIVVNNCEPAHVNSLGLKIEMRRTLMLKLFIKSCDNVTWKQL